MKRRAKDNRSEQENIIHHYSSMFCVGFQISDTISSVEIFVLQPSAHYSVLNQWSHSTTYKTGIYFNTGVTNMSNI